MKILILACSFAFYVTGFCSWPIDTLSALTIAKDPSAALASHLKGVNEVYLTAADYRGVTLTFNPETEAFICSIPIAYYEASSWLSGGHNDTQRDGWSQRPSKGLKNFHADVGSLIGILDDNSIKSRRISVVRSDSETNEVRAVWNNLEFSISLNDPSKLFAFLREYYGDYPPDTQVHIYIKSRVEQGGADQPATAPESKSEGKDKPQPESKVAPR